MASTARQFADGFLPLSLATLETTVPEGPGWVHEAKLDGYRIEAHVGTNARAPVRLYSRNGLDWTERFGVIRNALAAFPVHGAVLDGEVLAMVPRGTSAFQALQRQLETGDAHVRLRYVVFDVLQIEGRDCRALPLRDRQALLRELLRHRPARSPVGPVRRFSARGDLLTRACALGLEGVVSKRLDGRYVAGRHRDWLKIKCTRRQEFVVVGWSDPHGSRSALGALLLGVYDAAGRLHYAGKVGTGFDAAERGSLLMDLTRRERPRPAVEATNALPRGGVHWVTPELVVEIGFTEWTSEGLLRHPVYHGRRSDKPARAVHREDTAS